MRTEQWDHLRRSERHLGVIMGMGEGGAVGEEGQGRVRGELVDLRGVRKGGWGWGRGGEVRKERQSIWMPLGRGSRWWGKGCGRREWDWPLSRERWWDAVIGLCVVSRERERERKASSWPLCPTCCCLSLSLTLSPPPVSASVSVCLYLFFSLSLSHFLFFILSLYLSRPLLKVTIHSKPNGFAISFTLAHLLWNIVAISRFFFIPFNRNTFPLTRVSTPIIGAPLPHLPIPFYMGGDGGYKRQDSKSVTHHPGCINFSFSPASLILPNDIYDRASMRVNGAIGWPVKKRCIINGLLEENC